MKHTMHTVMEAVLKASAEGNRPLPVLTSNQCHALAQELNKILPGPVERKPEAWRVSISGNWEYFRSYEAAFKELREWQADYSAEELEEACLDGLCEPQAVYAI